MFFVPLSFIPCEALCRRTERNLLFHFLVPKSNGCSSFSAPSFSTYAAAAILRSRSTFRLCPSTAEWDQPHQEFDIFQLKLSGRG
ncbi:hypothetical protein HAX54_015529 [Datura stramonium]|uniref:Secreted protein n=1 Tax=Datura stramonium TaxID=4076 RepID=A0ABS8TQY6_DATST|nr:hypothetical protein [Datura stramonium]